MITDELDIFAERDDHGEAITGRMYHSDFGYIDISTQQRIGFVIGEDAGNYPNRGQMKMAGGNSSTITMSAGLDFDDNIEAYLDYQGDGVTDEIGTEGSEITDLVWNPAAGDEDPVAKVSVDENIIYERNSPITFSAVNSINHRGPTDLLGFDWVIEDFVSPDGSTATITPSAESATEAVFTTDTAGGYVIRLTVTDDIDGSSYTIDVKSFDVEN